MNKRSGIKTKQKILDAAKRVFSRHGYSDASIRIIAKAAGASVGGVYLYFKNKDELYGSLLKERIENHIRATRAAVSAAASPSAALLAFFRTNLRYAAVNRKLILTDVREGRFTFGTEIKRRALREQAGILERILIDGVNAGEFRPCRIPETVSLIMATLRGVVLFLIIEGKQVATPKGLMDFLLAGLQHGIDGALQNEAARGSAFPGSRAAAANKDLAIRRLL